MEPLDVPPAVDPADHTVCSQTWHGESYRVVRHHRQWWAWVTWPNHDDRVYPMPDEETARDFLERELARSILTRRAGQCLSEVDIVAPNGHRLLASAIVARDEHEQVMLATFDSTGPQPYSLCSFEETDSAIERFAAWVERLAERVAGDQSIDYRDLIAAHLRYRAAQARADAARARVGDIARHHRSRIRQNRDVRAVAHSLDVSREFFHRVLAGGEWNRAGRK